MEAPSSAHTRPSHMASPAPSTQPSMACGPCMAWTISGIVTNGPTPIMSMMLSAVASRRPTSRARPGSGICGTSVIARPRSFAKPRSLMSRAYQVHEQADGPGNSCRKLPGKSVRGEDVDSLAVVGQQESALLRRFARIVAGKQRFELRVPLRHEVETALLHPAVKIFLRDLVRPVEDLLFRRKDLYRLFFHRDAHIRLRGWVWCVVSVVKGVSALVVLDNQGPAAIHVIKQPAIVFPHVSPRVIRADADDDGPIAAEIARSQLLHREDAGVQTDTLQHRRNFIARAHDVTDLELRRQLHVHGLHVLRRRAIGVIGIKVGPRNYLEAFGVLLAVVFGAGRDLICALMQILRRNLE